MGYLVCFVGGMFVFGVDGFRKDKVGYYLELGVEIVWICYELYDRIGKNILIMLVI